MRSAKFRPKRRPPVASGTALRFSAAIDFMREKIDKRIRAIIPGDEGARASALLTGKRDAITPPVSDAFYVSSLAHVLAISGYHMAVVAGIAFFFIRGMLALAPWAIAHPNFQMSFAATLALIASYNRGLPWRANADTPRAARIALWGGGEIAALMFASLIAGLATTPCAAFHFHRLAPYGVLANLFAMPVVSVLGYADGHSRAADLTIRL